MGARPVSWYSRTMRTVSAAIASCAWSVEAPMWCVPMTPGSSKIGAVDVAGAARRLLGEDVEAGADALLADGALERRLVDDLGARGVDEERARLHRGEELARR